MQSIYTRCLLLFAALLALGGSAKASHILGGDMTYVYLGADPNIPGNFRYTITLKVYVDGTQGVPGLPNSQYPNGEIGNRPTLTIYNGTTRNQISNLSIPCERDNCPISQRIRIPVTNGCTVGVSDTAIRIFLDTYVSTVSLPFSLDGYYLYFSTAARSAQVLNLDLRGGGPGGVGNTYIAFIPSPIFPNSSPQFFSNATAFVCSSDTVTIFNNARDPDGDRLIYRFVNPYTGTNQQAPNQYTPPATVGFASGYSLAQPFGAGGYAYINTSTGETKYHIPTQGAYVVTFEVLEYRTLSSGQDTLLSTTRREIQLLSRDCLPNDPPRVTNGTPNIPPTTDYTITEGDSIAFTFGATDTDTTNLVDSIYITAQSVLLDGSGGYTGPRAQFDSVKGRNTIRARFSWHSACGTHGTYPVNVSVRDKGCPPKTTNSIFTINVLRFSAPQVVAGPDSACGGTGVTYTYSVTSTAPDSNFKWNVVGGTIVGSRLGKTVRVRFNEVFGGITGATVRIIQYRLGCVDSTSKTVRIFPLVPLRVVPPNPVLCQGDTMHVAARGGNNYLWKNANGSAATNLIAATDSSPRFFPRTTQIYTVTSLNVIGCPKTDTVTVTVIPDIPRTAHDTAICSGQTATIGSRLDTSAYAYSWSPTTGVATPTQPRSAFTLYNGAQRDTVYRYILQGRHRTSGCLSYDTVLFTVYPLPIVNAQPDTAALCSGKTAQLSVTSSYSATYLWTPATGLTSDTSATPRVTLTTPVDTITRKVYRVTVTTRLHGCVNRDSLTVRVNPLPRVLVGNQDSVCAGNSVVLGGPARFGYHYLWTPPSNFNYAFSSDTIAQPRFTTNVALGDTATRFNLHLRVINLYGCVDSSSLIFRRNNIPRSPLGPYPNPCSGDTITLGSRNNPLYRYNWHTLPVNAPGTYISDTTASAPRFSATNLPAGAPDRLIVLNEHIRNVRTGCEVFPIVTLTIHARPIINANAVNPLTVCSNDTPRVGTAAIRGYSYRWSGATGGSAVVHADSAQTRINLPLIYNNQLPAVASRFRFNLLVTTDSTGCTSRDSLILRVNPLPDVVASKDSVCSGLAHTLAFGSRAGVAATNTGFSFAWQPRTHLADSSLATPVFRDSIPVGGPAQTFVYNVRVQAQATGCVVTAPYAIKVLPLPAVVVGTPPVVCSGQQFTLGGPNVPGFGYRWSPAFGLDMINRATVTGTIRTSLNQQDSTVRYKLLVGNDITGCQNADSVTVTIHPLPVAQAGPDTAVTCSGVPIQIGVDSTIGWAYAWSPTSGLSSAIAAHPSLTLTSPTTIYPRYKVEVTNATTLCGNADSLIVRVNPLPVINLGTTTAVCAKDTATLGAPGNNATYTYNWSPAAGIFQPDSAQTRYSNSTPGLYRIALSEQNRITGCRSADTLSLRVNELPIAHAGPDTAVCSGTPVVLGGPTTTDQTFAWVPATYLTGANTSSPTFTRTDTGQTVLSDTLRITATYITTQCKGYDTVVVRTKPRPRPIQFSLHPDHVCPGTRNEPYGIANAEAGETYVWTVDPTGTLVSGQTTPNILVDWGIAAPRVIIGATATNSYQCVRLQADTFGVTVDQRLQPREPYTNSGNYTLCLDQAKELYNTVSSPNSTYVWKWAIGSDTTIITDSSQHITVRWPRAGDGLVWVEEIASPPPPAGVCFGRSEKRPIRINPSPDSTIRVINPPLICGGNTGRFILAGRDSSTYAWTINSPTGPTFQTANTLMDTLVSNPFVDAGRYPITVVETTNRGCVGRPIRDTATVNPVPVPTFGADSIGVCPQQAAQSFTVQPGLAGSTFTWTLAGGQITAGQGTPTIGTALDTNATVMLSVVETSAPGCASLPVAAPIVQDRTRVDLAYVTLQPGNDGAIDVAYTVSGSGALRQPVQLLRADGQTGTFASITALGGPFGSQTIFTDANPLPTNQHVNAYRIETVNRCGITVRSQTAATMLLTGTADEAKQSVSLAWTPYIPGSTAFGAYQVLRKLGDAPDFALAPAGGTNALAYQQNIGGDGFTQSFRIAALGLADGQISLSNTITLSFENALIFYNIVTPNGDGFNDVLGFKNVKLYPDNTLRINNRWGRQVYSTSNYQGDYDCASLEGGTYFYEFTVNGNTHRGWFEVMK